MQIDNKYNLFSVVTIAWRGSMTKECADTYTRVKINTLSVENLRSSTQVFLKKLLNKIKMEMNKKCKPTTLITTDSTFCH